MEEPAVWQSPKAGREGMGTLLNQRREERATASGVPNGEAGSTRSRRQAKQSRAHHKTGQESMFDFLGLGPSWKWEKDVGGKTEGSWQSEQIPTVEGQLLPELRFGFWAGCCGDCGTYFYN